MSDLRRRFAQCGSCHAIWTTHDVPPSGDATNQFPCPECNDTMYATWAVPDTGKIRLPPGWHQLGRREDIPLFRADEDAFVASTFISGHHENGDSWSDALIHLPTQSLSLRDDKFILLAYRFDTFLPRLSDQDLQEVSREYIACVYKILAEMTLRGVNQGKESQRGKRQRA